MPHLKIWQLAGGSVDSKKLLISGVSVITEGEARGHSMWVDSQTLREVKACAESYKGGLKVKMDHYSGITATVGYLSSFRIEGVQLKADLQLFKSIKDAADFIIEMAETIPDMFGFSIVFSGSHHNSPDGKVYARCSEIYSADIVDSPAANPNGLFEKAETVDTKNKHMPLEIKDIQAALAEVIKPISERLTSLESKAATLAPVPEPKKEEKTEKKEEKLETKPQENQESLEDKVAVMVVKEMAKLGHSNPVKNSPESSTPEKKKFQQLLKDKEKEGKSKSEAMTLCVAEFPEEYKEYREKVLGVRMIEETKL